MTKTALTFKSLKIHKAPGFTKGLPAMDNLNSNINIITGANASGKSTTARAIQSLIWKHDVHQLHAEAVVETDNNWFLKIDHGNTVSQKDGKNEALTNIPAADDKRLYMLAIQDLIQKEEQDLADEIMKESIGGYDLEAAKKALNYEDKISNVRTKEHIKYQEENDALKNLKQTHQALKNRENNLNNLYDELENARKAEKLKSWYAAIAEYLEAKRALEQKQQFLKQFPENIDKVTGKEVDEVKELEPPIRETENAIQQTETEIQELEKTLGSLHIPTEGVDEQRLNTLDKYVQYLNENERGLRDINKHIKSATSEEKDALAAINPELTPGGWEGIDLYNIAELDKFLTEAQDVFAKERSIIKEIELIESDINDIPETPKASVLNKGIDYLGRWLKTPAKSTSRPIWVMYGMVAAAIITAVLCWLFGWPGLFGLIVVAVLPLLSNWLTGKQSSADDSLAFREGDYEKTGLTPPHAWNTKEVINQLNALIDELNEAKWQEKSADRLKDRKQQLDDLSEKIKGIYQKHQQLLEKFKAAPNIEDVKKDDFSSMRWFIDNLKKWQTAHINLNKSRAEREQMIKEQDGMLNKCNEVFSALHFDQAYDAAQAGGTYHAIKNEEIKRSQAEQQLKDKNKSLKSEKNRLKSYREKYNTVFTRLDIDVGDLPSLQHLTDQKPDYDKTSKEVFAAQERSSEKQNNLESHSLYDEHQDDINTLSPDEIEEKRQEQNHISEKQESISKEINETEFQIKQKKEGRELEELISKKEEAVRDLEGLYERNMSSITGNLVVETLKQTHMEENQPEVLARAGTLFNKITNGRYELLTDENNSRPAFKAKDSLLKSAQPLSELSTGTRVQLILAVRLAFIEHNESALRLPLLADELLANSDDIRAKAIINTLITISKEGRQVFYFTAQADEAFKWKTMIDEHPGISFKSIPLDKNSTEVKPFSYAEKPAPLVLIHEVPPPKGKSHSTYAREINPPHFDLLQDVISKLHLWYIIEDTELLYCCLKQGIAYWGQLQSYLRYNGHIPGLTDTIKQKLQDKVTIISNFIESYRIGRPKPIDRSVLVDSSAISDTFIDDVDALLKQLNGNPEALINALKAGKVSKFRTKNIEELNHYLEEEGYIDNADPLSNDEIKTRLQALISTMNISFEDGERIIKWLI
ncbi:MAG: hypothetical protein ACOCVX_03705 [Bacteroidales bacterium]